MADADSSSTLATESAESNLGLIVEIRETIGISEFHGTRAMIEGEGIIPAKTEWPQGYDNLYWQAGQFNYWLRRERPPGAKGSRRQFIDCDWWFLRWELTEQPSYAAREIKRKTKELSDAIYRQSAIGRAENDEHWSRYWKAKEDDGFQAFKALIPGLVPPKRGRRAKSAERA